MSFNDLNGGSKLEVGSTLIIPNGEAMVVVQALAKVAPKATAKVAAPSYAGYYMRPITGGVRTQGIHGYNAVDLASSCGTPVYASASGNVLIAKTGGWNSGYGNYIVISHPNGTQTLYAHFTSLVVAPGWAVTKGNLIGYMGTTGLSTGCHVHFEIRGAKNPF